MFKMKREWLISNFCKPVYEEWLAEAVAKGRINAKGFFSDPAIRAAWSGAEWYGASQGQIDPEKEARAAQLRVQEGFSTRERESTELTGMSFEKIQNIRNREEIQRAKTEANITKIKNDEDLKYRREVMEIQAEIQSKYSQGQSLGGFFNMPDNNKGKTSENNKTEVENENESENESENENKEENTNA
jgi:capsid protein